MKLFISHKEYFSASHRLYNPAWSDKKNKAVFDKCSNLNYHGHNYWLTATVSGEPDPVTGRVYDIRRLGAVMTRYIVQPFNYKNLNIDLEYFKKLNPTAENIAAVIWAILRPHIEEKYDLKILLHETERNFVEYPIA